LTSNGQNMQVKIFTVSINQDNGVEEELNRFLRSHKILEVDRELVVLKNNAYWSFAISYLPGGGSDSQSVAGKRNRVDYKKVLDSASFERYNAYRTIRKKVAQTEGVPVYAIFTNHELAEMAKLGDPITTKGLLEIPWIGQGKIEKYASYFIENEASE